MFSWRPKRDRWFTIIVLLLSAIASRQVDSRPRLPQEQPQSEVRFPSDSGVVNVKDKYGAVGDGKTDDTSAIMRAIGDNRGVFERILYFPTGTYIVSTTLRGTNQDGIWKARLTFQGEDKNTTIIRLRDNLPEFQEPISPRSVIQTGSIEPFNKMSGTGNNGFRNYIFNLTVDTGRGNPGAIGVDYLGNNICGLEDVIIRSGDSLGIGVAGLSMTRSYVGPCLYKRVEIDGFDYGILSTSTEYSHTFEHLKLTGQHIAGISNTANVLSIRDLESMNAVPAIVNADSKGLVTLVDSELRSPQPASSAIVNKGGLAMRNISVIGYATTVEGEQDAQVAGSIVEHFSPGTVPSGFSPMMTRQHPLGNVTLNLPIEESPRLGSYDLSEWVNVQSKGAIPDGKTDSTKAIQAALDSSADVVYLPAGTYRVTDTLRARGRTHKILGLGAVLLPDGAKFENLALPTALFRFESKSSDIAIEGIQFGWWTHRNYPGVVWIEDASTHTLVLEHDDFEGVARTVFKVDPCCAGSVFLEDVAGAQWQFDARQRIWARQFDVEGNVEGSKVINNGAFLWILGMKTEGPQTAIDTENGGSTELLGALLYPVRPVMPGTPAFMVNKSSVTTSYAISAYKAEKNYQIQFQIVRGKSLQNVKSSDVTKRGNGSLAIMPLISLTNE
jgi:hypothetical protein